MGRLELLDQAELPKPKARYRPAPRRRLEDHGCAGPAPRLGGTPSRAGAADSPAPVRDPRREIVDASRRGEGQLDGRQAALREARHELPTDAAAKSTSVGGSRCRRDRGASTRRGREPSRRAVGSRTIASSVSCRLEPGRRQSLARSFGSSPGATHRRTVVDGAEVLDDPTRGRHVVAPKPGAADDVERVGASPSPPSSGRGRLDAAPGFGARPTGVDHEVRGGRARPRIGARARPKTYECLPSGRSPDSSCLMTPRSASISSAFATRVLWNAMFRRKGPSLGE